MNHIPSSKTILVAPLNWGLGHATRCIPIIKQLQQNNFIPIIASDGAALELLRKEFPYLQSLELPSYRIQYAKKGYNFKWKMLKNIPNIINAIGLERKLTKKWVKKYNISGIISDNRMGVYSKKVPSVFITHQLKVLSGLTTWFTSKWHQGFIKKFDQCWVPDVETETNLAGKLSHLKNIDWKNIYIGPLSRLQYRESEIVYDLLILLSGPEPQRRILEEKLKKELTRYNGKVLFVQGIVEGEPSKITVDNITYCNYLNSKQVELSIHSSKHILCRSGYTTMMDLAAMKKKAFLIPTPGQYEQEYLAKKYQKENILPYAEQSDFKIEMLDQLEKYKGFEEIVPKPNMYWKGLFEVFLKKKVKKPESSSILNFF